MPPPTNQRAEPQADVLKATQAADDLIAISTRWNDADVIALSNGYRALRARVQALNALLDTRTRQTIQAEAQRDQLVEALEGIEAHTAYSCVATEHMRHGCCTRNCDAHTMARTALAATRGEQPPTTDGRACPTVSATNGQEEVF